MEEARVRAAIAKSKEYIDSLTVDSTVNVPEEVVANEHRFFTWDSEKRSPSAKPYLFDWSCYNGVVMEGLFDVWKAKPAGGGRYLDAMIVTGPDGKRTLSRTLAGYVDHHGADCYKTAALLFRAS